MQHLNLRLMFSGMFEYDGTFLPQMFLFFSNLLNCCIDKSCFNSIRKEIYTTVWLNLQLSPLLADLMISSSPSLSLPSSRSHFLPAIYLIFVVIIILVVTILLIYEVSLYLLQQLLTFYSLFHLIRTGSK